MEQEDRQITLEEVEKEIQRELRMPEAVGIEPPFEVKENENPSRKPFRIKDFESEYLSPHDKEMAVFTHAKKLSEYIFVITEKSPKKLRWSIVSRLQNASVEIVENLYRANYERETTRIEYQKSAAVGLRILDFYSETARKKRAITIRQTEIIARQISETTRLLNGWVKSTKRNKTT